MLQFPYMGTKHALAPIVASVAGDCPEGPFLDAFAGMCSVANRVQSARTVWTNDLQRFAVTAAKTMLCDTIDSEIHFDHLKEDYDYHFHRLSTRFRAALREERLLLSTKTEIEFSQRYRSLEEQLDRKSARQFDLFATLYANTYIGLEQAIEMDALLYSLSRLRSDEPTKQAVRRRFTFALGRSLLRASTTTGHFAQFQTPSESNWKRFQRTRRLSIYDLVKSDYSKASDSNTLHPEQNRAFNLDAIALLRALRRARRKPAVVYADPPYKQDQYSRYYHLLETLVLYDYPRVSGKAKYRGSRPTSIFSSKSKSYRGIESLAALTSKVGAEFILSYPEDGIAGIGRDQMVRILSDYFRKVEVVHEGKISHSTMGASKGSATQPVVERIYLGRN